MGFRILALSLVVVALTACSSSSSSKSPSTQPAAGAGTTSSTHVPEVGNPTAKDCAEIQRRNAVQAKWDAGVGQFNALSQAERDRYNDPAAGDPGGGYAAWAREHGFPTVNPNYGTVTSDACP